MASFSTFHVPAKPRNPGSVCLAFFWTLGLLLGAFSSLFAGTTASSLIRSAISAPTSVFVLLSTVLLPFLCALIAVAVSAPGWLPCICFVKAVCFSSVSVLVFQTFGSAGWLMRCLVLFSDIATAPLLYSFCRRHITGVSTLSISDFFTVAAAACFCLVDWAYISPFLSDLITL